LKAGVDMVMKQLYLAWQDPQSRSWHPVGLLTMDESGTYRFVYTKGAEKIPNFCLGRMKALDAVYESTELFPLFSNRLLSNSRPEFKKYLVWLNIRNDDPLKMLAITEGIRGTDTLEVFKCPTRNNKGEYEVVFLSHGLRHLPSNAVDRVNTLKRGDKLFLVLDPQNMYDPMAIALRTDDPVQVVGYCPRYLSQDFHELLYRNRPVDVIVSVERVNTDAPLNLRLICRIIAPWPDKFEPCSSEEFMPLADYRGKMKQGERSETPANLEGVH
jgi:hypothetical protein